MSFSPVVILLTKIACKEDKHQIRQLINVCQEMNTDRNTCWERNTEKRAGDACFGSNLAMVEKSPEGYW